LVVFGQRITLVDLLIVIIITAVLAAIAIPEIPLTQVCESKDLIFEAN